MAIISLDPDTVVEYSLSRDEGPDKTVFLLGVLDSFLMGQIGKEAHVDQIAAGEDNPGSGKAFALLNLTALYGIKGWRNFRDQSGNEIPFETEDVEIELIGTRPVMKRTLLRRFKVSDITELASQIQRNSVLSETERGN